MSLKPQKTTHSSNTLVIPGSGHIPHGNIPIWQLLVGGLIGGFGARMGNGCTSGHGICGLGTLSRASLLSVAIFLVTAIITANIVHALGGA